MNLKHVALYSKNWYERSKNFFEDVKACLRADDYTPETNYDVLSILITNVAPLFQNIPLERYTRELLADTAPSQCWKTGYYTKDHTWLMSKSIDEFKDKEYDRDEAILFFFLSKLSSSTKTELGGLPQPSADVLPLRQRETV